MANENAAYILSEYPAERDPNRQFFAILFILSCLFSASANSESHNTKAHWTKIIDFQFVKKKYFKTYLSSGKLL